MLDRTVAVLAVLAAVAILLTLGIPRRLPIGLLRVACPPVGDQGRLIARVDADG